MRFSFLLAVTFSLLLMTTACTADGPDAVSVYRSYLAEIETIESLQDREFEKYLSHTARDKLAEETARRANSIKQCSPCPSEEQELEMMKIFRPYPAADLEPAKSTSDEAVTLTYVWHQPAGSGRGIGDGSDITLVAELIREAGEWKLKSESWVMAENPGTMSTEGKASWSY